MWLKVAQLVAYLLTWIKETCEQLLAATQRTDTRATRAEMEAMTDDLRGRIKEAEARLFSPLLGTKEWEDLRAERANLARLYAELQQRLESKYILCERGGVQGSGSAPQEPPGPQDR